MDTNQLLQYLQLLIDLKKRSFDFVDFNHKKLDERINDVSDIIWSQRPK